jgi:probable phosphoglycerate mutase
VVGAKAEGVMLALYVIRHGETEWALTGQHTGSTDIPLTVHGEAEARELRASLAGIDFAAVLVSPRQRASRTCELAGLGPQAVVEANLVEWDYGSYEGRRTVDIRRERPDWNIFRDGCPRGELPAHVAARSDRLIDHLCTLGGNVALFTHGQFGCVLAARWIGLPVVDAQHLTFGPASRSILTYSPSHPDVRVIALWNAPPNLRLS